MATLRKKTLEKLPEEKCRILEGVVDNFLEKDGPDAEEAIWKLCYQPETELMWMGFPEDTSVEEAKVIQAEMGSQYRTAHKEWTYGETYKAHVKANTENAKRLKKALKNEYTFDTVMGRLLEFSYRDINVVLKVLQCLGSRREESRYGGFKTLKFDNTYEVQYLLPYATLVKDLFEEMVSHRLKEEESMPFYFGSEKRREGTYENPPQPEASGKEVVGVQEVHREEKRGALSPIELIQKRKEIEDFFKALEVISQNPNAEWLSEHEAQVKEFFIQCDKFK